MLNVIVVFGLCRLRAEDVGFDIHSAPGVGGSSVRSVSSNQSDTDGDPLVSNLRIRCGCIVRLLSFTQLNTGVPFSSWTCWWDCKRPPTIQARRATTPIRWAETLDRRVPPPKIRNSDSSSTRRKRFSGAVLPKKRKLTSRFYDDDRRIEGEFLSLPIIDARRTTTTMNAFS